MKARLWLILGARMALLWLAIGLRTAVGASTADCPHAFSVDDYFQTRRIVELAISDSGDRVVYATENWSLNQDRKIREVFVVELAPGAKPVPMNVDGDAHDIAWIPRSSEFAYLSAKSGVSQIYSLNVGNESIRQRTFSLEHVVQFRFSPDGRSLAYSTIPLPSSRTVLFERARAGESGVLIDTDRVGLADLVNPDWAGTFAQRFGDRKLWLQVATRPATVITLSGSVLDFYWASDSRFLSVTYVDDTIPERLLVREYLSSVGIVDAATGQKQVLFEGHTPRGEQPGLGFGGGQWVPHRNQVVVFRTVESKWWVNRQFPEWTVSPVAGPVDDKELSWRAVETFDEGVQPITEKALWVENTTRGVRSLFEWRGARISPARVVRGLDGSSSQFTFSRDLRSAVFVNQSLSRPPEIYLWRENLASAVRITGINAATTLPCGQPVEAITWTSLDGEQASGWLFKPRAQTSQPQPLVTYVHGGPGSPVTDAFCPTFSSWPYPLEVFPAYGIAVFIPNYRGTMTFGRRFSSPSSQDNEPVGDIISGLRHLVALGVADPDRLGIAGHSHGAWLGPMVMIQEPRFKAASFAEGAANWVVLHESTGAVFNREIQDPQLNGSLYDVPERYLAISPDLHFKGISSANLFEGGIESAALQALAFGKASNRVGLPTETIIYPKSGHTLATPRQQKESAERNLDWFRFWIKGEVDDSPEKAQQYARWRALRAQHDALSFRDASTSSHR